MVDGQDPARRDWIVAPGEILVEALEDRDMTQAELARRMGRPLKTINEIANGKAAVTPETAIQLERSLGISAAFWNGLEKRYREELALRRSEEELSDYSAWARAFPLKEMIDRELLPNESGESLTAALLQFFRVGNPTGWGRFWAEGSIRFRLAPSHEPDLPALAAWVRWGELEAARISVGPFDELAFRAVLVAARAKTRSGLFNSAISWLRAECAKAGVALVVLPEFRGTRTSGAARWLRSDVALIQLSARYKTSDQFWFSFFHEAGHLLLEGRRSDVVEDFPELAPVDMQGEQAADAFARTTLIPESEWHRIIETQDFSEEAIRAYAEALEVDAGIVLGRLQRDGHVPPGRLNALKHRIDLVLA